MTQYEDFLSPKTNVAQRILTPATRQGLVNQGILRNIPNGRDVDTPRFPTDIVLPITYSDCPFHHVPYQFVSRAFLEYLGIKPSFSKEMLLRISCKHNNNLSGKVIYTYLKNLVKESLDENGKLWQSKFGEGVLPIDTPIDDVMDWLGFCGPFCTALLRLKILSFGDHAMMNFYLVEEKSIKTFHDLNMIDYMLAMLLRRLENLRSFENAARIYLEQTL